VGWFCRNATAHPLSPPSILSRTSTIANRLSLYFQILLRTLQPLKYIPSFSNSNISLYISRSYSAPYAKMTTHHQMCAYERYKSDTATFVSWLVTASQDLGNKIPQPIDLDQELSRLSVADDELEADTPRDYLYTTAQILSFAQYIKDHSTDMTVTMSRGVWTAYRRAVALRRRFGERYARENLPSENGEGQAAVDGHDYFLYVLMESARLLRGCVQVQPVASSSVLQSPDPLEGSSVYEALLELIDDGETGDELLDMVGNDDDPDGTETLRPRYRLPKRSSTEELEFQLFCLTQDAAAGTNYTVEKFEASNNGLCDEYTPLIMAEAVVDHVRRRLVELNEYAIRHNIIMPSISFSTGAFFSRTTSILETILPAIMAEQARDPEYPVKIPQVKDAEASWTEDYTFMAHCLMELVMEYVS
jgi:hypothetical protein